MQKYLIQTPNSTRHMEAPSTSQDILSRRHHPCTI